MLYEAMTTAQQVGVLRAMVEKSVGHSVQVHLDAESQAHRDAFATSHRATHPTQGFDSQGRPIPVNQGFDSQGRPIPNPVQRFDSQGRLIPDRNQRLDAQGRLINDPTRLYVGGPMTNRPLRSEQERKAAAASLQQKQQALQARLNKNKKKP